MLATFNQIGRKLSFIFGAPSTGNDQYDDTEELKKEVFCFDSLASLLCYQSFEECELNGVSHGLFINDNSVGFTLECTPLVGGDRSIHKTLSGLLETILEEGVSIQCLLFADHRLEPFFNAYGESRKNQGELFLELVKQRALYLTKSKDASARNFRFIISLSMPGQPSDHLCKKIIDKKLIMHAALDSLTQTYDWGPHNLIDLASAFINFSFHPTPLKKKWNPLQSFSSQIPSGGKITIEEEGIQWSSENPVTLKTYRAVDYPDFWHLNLMGNLIGDFYKDSFRINTSFFIHYGIHCPKQSKEESTYWRKSRLIENQGKSGFLRKIIPSLEQEISEVDHVRRALNEGAKFVRTQLSVGFWSSNENIESTEHVLKSLFRMEGFHIEKNRYLHLPSLLATLPMSWGEYADDLYHLCLLRTTLSNEACNFIPLQAEWSGTSKPAMPLLGRRGQILNFNPFDQATNANTTIVGQSGSGKSVFMQDLLMSFLGIGSKVYVLDVGGSFEKMCEIIKGQKIEFKHNENICLNPFTYLPKDSEERGTFLGALKSIISTMAHPSEGSSDLETALIEKAIIDVIDMRGNRGTITDVANTLEKYIEKQANELAVMLRPYTSRGSFAKYFEGEGNVDFHNPMVLIDLEQLKSQPQLQAVVLQIFIMEISQKIFLGNRQTKTIICIDEAWELLKAKQTAPFIETIARRIRKYNGALIVGTQSVADFFQSPGAMSAYENSCWTCLLEQKPESIAAYEKISRSPEGKIKALETVVRKGKLYSEVMISESSSGYSIARLYLDPFSQLLYSTTPADRKLIEPLREKGLSITEAIKQVLQDNH